MDKTVKITVLLPVYNAEKHLRACIDSILAQTFQHFSVLIINDGSNDGSVDIIQSYNDARIVFINRSENKGLINTLNEGLSKIHTQYIARMDADDIALPNRLEKQFAFMEAHPEVGLCGGQMLVFGKYEEVWDLPESHNKICAELLFKNKICHPTVMLRSAVLNQYKLDYTGPYMHLEDYYLWHQLKHKTRFHNLPDVLINYRLEGQNITAQNQDTEKQRIIPMVRHITDELGLNLNDEACVLHYFRFEKGHIPITRQNIKRLRKHLKDILNANKSAKVYDQADLSVKVSEIWDSVFPTLLRRNPRAVLRYWWIGRKCTFVQLRQWFSTLMRK